jgi:hypothetical protein
MSRSFSDAVQEAGRRASARRWAVVVLACCIAVFTFGPLASAQAAGTSTIEGTVSAAKGGALEGIEVTASGTESGSAVTGPTGKYEIKNLAKGSYTVRFEDPAQTYLSRELPATISVEGEHKVLDAALNEFGAIKGRVTNAATGNGLSGATVSVEGPSSFNFTSTDSNGFYTLAHLEPGSYRVEFEAPGYPSQSTFVVVGEGTTEANAALKEGGRISGTVTDAVTHGGLAKIGVYASSPSGFGYALTNANGEYTITGLPAGSYKLLYEWEFSTAEFKEFEKAPRAVPKYIAQYYSGQISQSTANQVAVTEGALTSGINVAMVPSAPHNTALPVVSGATAVGSLLSCSNGSWTGESLLKLAVGWPLTTPFSYQWFKDGVAIAGATSDAYLIQAADVGHGVICEVTATTEAGRAGAKSSTFTVVAPVPVIKIIGSKLKAVKRLIKVSIACANATCTGTVKVIGTVLVKHKGKKKAKKQAIVLATGSYSLAAGKTGTVTLRLSAAGKKALTRASHHRESVKLLATVTGGKSVQAAAKLSLVGH